MMFVVLGKKQTWVATLLATSVVKWPLSPLRGDVVAPKGRAAGIAHVSTLNVGNHYKKQENIRSEKI